MEKHADDQPLSKAAPHNIDLEQAIIGTLMLSNNGIEQLSHLRPEHFFDPLHEALFGSIEAMLSDGKPASPFTIGPKFAESGPVGSSPDVRTYLGSLVARAVSIGQLSAYADELIGLAARRTLIVTAEDLRAEAFDLSVERTADELIEMAEARLYAVAPKQANDRGETSLADALAAAISEANDAHQRGTGLAGQSTGFRDLDARTGGLSNGNFIVLAGRPSMGKTALGTNIAHNLASNGVPVAFFSLEMTASELSKRILARQSGVAVHKIARGTFNPGDMADLLRAEQTLKTLPLTIDATGGLTVAQIRAKARRLRRKGKLDVLIVDYLQLMQGSQRPGSTRVAEVTEITTGLKALAKELGVPVIALSQLNRAVEARENKRPGLADLRESGSIEQDADVVLMCYREAYYVEREKPPATDQAAYADWLVRLNAVRDHAEVIIAKNRQGALGTVEMRFEGATTTFSDAEVAP